MSSYIILYDTKRKVSVRTTSYEVVLELKKLEPKLIEVANVGGRNCNVLGTSQVENYNASDYKKLFNGGKQ
jgi:hypothetical protein